MHTPLTGPPAQGPHRQPPETCLLPHRQGGRLDVAVGHPRAARAPCMHPQPLRAQTEGHGVGDSCPTLPWITPPWASPATPAALEPWTIFLTNYLLDLLGFPGWGAPSVSHSQSGSPDSKENPDFPRKHDFFYPSSYASEEKCMRIWGTHMNAKFRNQEHSTFRLRDSSHVWHPVSLAPCGSKPHLRQINI